MIITIVCGCIASSFWLSDVVGVAHLVPRLTWRPTLVLEDRRQYSCHSAIWKVLETFEWLLDQLETLKTRLKDVNYKD
jgi:hypothetical protein